MSGVIKEDPCYVVFKKPRFVWRYPYKNLYDNSVAFHSIVMLVMLCVFGHPHHAHVYIQVTMVYIDSFG